MRPRAARDADKPANYATRSEREEGADAATGAADDEGGEDDQSITPMVDEETESDAPILDASERDLVRTLTLQSGKEYAAASSRGELESVDFTLLGGAPWLDIEALDCDGFVDKYAADGCLTGEIPL